MSSKFTISKTWRFSRVLQSFWSSWSRQSKVSSSRVLQRTWGEEEEPLIDSSASPEYSRVLQSASETYSIELKQFVEIIFSPQE